MAVREYIGARYVPIFGRKGETDITWDNSEPYEPLTVVLYQGNSYISTQYVPSGIGLNDTTASGYPYWVETGNYNAQIEAYRQEVLAFDSRITSNADDIDNLESQLSGSTASGLKTLINTNASSISSIESDISSINDDISDLETLTSTKDELIYIGDSWGTRNNKLIPTYVANFLNCTLHDYSVSGMGFVYGESNYSVLADTVISDTSVNADNVKYIVLEGGSNDYSHEIADTSINNAITSIVTKLKAKFKKARIHVFFNPRFKYSNTYYKKLNDQIIQWKTVTQRIAYQNAGIIAHPESMTWLNKSLFEDDLVHPTESASKYWAQYLASTISGTCPNPGRTNITNVSLDAYTGVSGHAYMFFDIDELRIDAHLNVTAEQVGTSRHGLKSSADGLFPVQVNRTEEQLQLTNRVSIPMNRLDGIGSCTLDVWFTTSTGGDVVYISPIADDIAIPIGQYQGSVRMNLLNS